MRNHRIVSRVAPADLAGDELLRQLLAIRGERGAPHDESIETLRKDLARRRSIPCHLIVRVLLANLEDGAPLEDVLAFPRLLTGILVAHAQARGEPGALPCRDVSTLQAIETELEGALNRAQIRAAYDRSPAAVVELRDRAQSLVPVLHEMVSACNRELFTSSTASAA